MEYKCPCCVSGEIINGTLEAAYRVVFVPENQKGSVRKSSLISALACKKCGAVFGMKPTDKPLKLTD